MQRNRRKSRKKGTILDIMFLLVILFIIAIVFLVGKLIFANMTEALVDTGRLTNTSASVMTTFEDRYITLFDGVFLFVMIGGTIAVAVSAFMVREHPAFFFISLALLIIFVALAAIFSNVFSAIETQSTFSEFSGDFTIMHYIMGHLPLFIAIIGIIILIVLYAKVVTL